MTCKITTWTTFIYTCENVRFPFHFAGSSTFSRSALAFLLCRIIVDCCRRCQWHPAPPVHALVLTFTGLLSECRNSLDDTEGLKLRPVGGQEPCWNVFAQIISVIRKTSQKSTLLFRRDTWLWARRYFHVTYLKRHFYYCIILFISFLFL